ncbi:9229_t:CDS:2 [Cetraspora pellucida]|uniref:9229_t:CDS:1 n=1 Tax=Cetraspora pellucida TaxID=1433469 RepID=A0A9N8VXH8_9GLOM|nr:9229_t:CDS:2 [Cetraspora pellucida]
MYPMRVFATNGQEAIDIIKSESELSTIIKPCRISLILTECNLPTISGFDFSQTVRLMEPPISDIPIIALTSLPLEEIGDKYIKSGMNDYLSKPLKTNQLENVLTKWISNNSIINN